MTRPLKIVIVGGGTAGWMTAAGLSSVLTPQLRQVRLIESDEIGIVGVGEATLPQMKEFNDFIGVNEADFMRRTNGSFKLGIQFVDWGFKGSRYIHPFGVHGQPIAGAGFQHAWTKARLLGRDHDVDDFSYAIVAARENRFDFPAKDPRAINSTYSYAYHFDASLYAQYLRRFAEGRGVQRTEGKVVDVTLDPTSGDVASLKLQSGEVVTADLFVDCSGFRSLLLGQALNNDYEDWTKWLPCDRALAVPCERVEPVTPYTRSTAREAGWQWRIPLQHRTGNGYVYSSAFIDDDKAAETLMANLDGKALGDPKPLRFKAGRRTKSWDRNCLAVGLASGFLEPLESTSIYLIQVAILHLLRLLPTPGQAIEPALRNEFNRLVDVEYSRVRDFLILHYYANSRDDAELWRYCREMQVPDSLLEKIELFKHRGALPKYRDGLFAPPSWLSVFAGQGLRPSGYDRRIDNLPDDRLLAEVEAQRARVAERVAAMPEHGAFLDDYCGPAEPTRQAATAGA
jgi:tryptophan halogenase